MVFGLYKAIDFLKLSSNAASVEISGIFVIIHLLFFYLVAGFTVDGRAFKLRVFPRTTRKNHKLTL